jgi:NAD(P)-dependent dehydrogenase (short-subunit alcohol dehydrogenase family)
MAQVEGASPATARLWPDRHRDRTYIITGAGSGIGATTAKRLAAEGAAIAVADIRREGAEAVAAEINGKGGRALAIACDVSSEPEVEAMVAQTLAAFGGVSGLYANAGMAGVGWIHELSLEAWRRVLDVNLTGTFLCAKHVLPHLLTDGGVVLTTGSVASVVVGPGGSAASYAASKGAVLQFTRQIAVDYGAQGVRAVCVLPGMIQTDISRHLAEDWPADVLARHRRLPRPPLWAPIPGHAEPDQIAGVVSFLFSEDASFITGCSILVDGGMTAI